jgi:hypothetical protein
MKNRTNIKLSLTVSVFLLAASQANLAQAAENPSSSQPAPPVYNPGYQYYPPQSAQGYGMPGNLTPGYTPPSYGGRNYGRGGSGPSFSGPWDSGRGGSGPCFSGPWDSGRGSSGPGFSGPWDSNRGGRSMPWDSNRGRSMPWGDNRRGGSSMPWDSGRGGWMNKDKFADGWDDMLNAPSDMGEMPGGYTAPSVSMPNPVDVGDEFNDAASDAPDQMRNVYDDNRRSNTNNRYGR